MQEITESQGQEKPRNRNRGGYQRYRRRPGTPRPEGAQQQDNGEQPTENTNAQAPVAAETERPQEKPRQQQQQERPARQYDRDRNQHQRRERNPERNRFVGFQEKVSVIIPLLNEAESLRPLSFELKKAFNGLTNNFEVIFIDDGSTDNSLSFIRQIREEDKRFKYISFQKNFGKSAALQVGFEAATGDIVITMDADLQDDPAEIPNLVKKILEGWDMVSGWKKIRYDPFIKKYSSRFFNATTRMMSGIKIHDFNCGLKAYRGNVVKNLKVYGELHRYIPVLASWQGFSVTELAVQHHPRKYGKTKFGISRFFKGFIDLITVVFVTRYIKRPMHLFGFLGALAFIIGFFVNGYLTIEWFQGKMLSNRPMLFLGMLLIIVGVQFFTTGLLGEMMVHNAAQRTDEYVVKDKRLK